MDGLLSVFFLWIMHIDHVEYDTVQPVCDDIDRKLLTVNEVTHIWSPRVVLVGLAGRHCLVDDEGIPAVSGVAMQTNAQAVASFVIAHDVRMM